jgi:uncharacterized protein (DUF885 family)
MSIAHLQNSNRSLSFGAMAIISALLVVFVLGCQSSNKSSLSESERFNAWTDKQFDAAIDRHPEWQTYLGIKKDYDKLQDRSDEVAKKELAISKAALKEMKSSFDYDKLDDQTKITYDLFKRQLEREVAEFKWRFHNYPVNQLFGRHSGLPSFMINMHKISNENDAKAYISRIKAVDENFTQLIEGLKTREDMGVIPPKFAFPKVAENIQTLLSGEPFTKGNTDSSILADFKRKLSELKEMKAETKQVLTEELITALKADFQPGYQNLLAYWTELEKKADTRDGVWKLPNGADYYNVMLENYTTTDMTAQEIHALGLKEVKRIHQEMSAIQKKLKVAGTLQDFFKHVQKNKKLFYPQTESGKEKFLADTQAIIDDMRTKLPSVFGILPKAGLEVKPVEPFREKSSASAFYTGPAPDGSRPGIYYVNLVDMKEQPKYTMEALAYHEAIPGHHMQIAISMELDGLPKFRRYGIGFAAYSEGWGLYSEYVPKEMGFYRDPYSDFGRLSMELLRAIRLVVDTGIHYKKWTREQAIDYVVSNSPGDKAEAVRSIERYIVIPGQATSYKIGMLKIMELREKAKTAMGDKFNLAQFHDQVLKNGPLPLSILESQIDKWIQTASR